MNSDPAGLPNSGYDHRQFVNEDLWLEMRGEDTPAPLMRGVGLTDARCAV